MSCELTQCGNVSSQFGALPVCTNKLSVVHRFGQKAGLRVRRGGVRWIKERCGKGGISRQLLPRPPPGRECQIYRILPSPGKRGGFDAHTDFNWEYMNCRRWMMFLQLVTCLRKGAERFHTHSNSSRLHGSSKICFKSVESKVKTNTT